ncbi:MAG TPA: HAMP domain-containing histidine kinase [Crenotrichaceae bacterium]|nr:HAMP domain-containing histidine kinase [Crenotrichaceae bacterium]
MRNLLIRPVLIVSVILGIFIIGELIVIGGLAWRNHQRLDILKQDISNGHRLEDSMILLLSHQLQHSGANNNQSIEVESRQWDSIKDPEMRADIKQLQQAFANTSHGDLQSLMQALNTTRQLFLRHTRKEENLLNKIGNDSRLEFELAVTLPLVLIIGVILIGRYFFKRNVLAPLDSLKNLLQKLADGDRQPIQLESSDPVMQPLFDNYNQLVMRLTELEKEQLNYTSSLESKVHQITSELLEQSQQIARSERLSVVAELAASTAHELRNPLAGIQMALENILQENLDTELADRLGNVSNEVKRLTRHLNDLLALTHTSAKQPDIINIKQLCLELKHFLVYQMPQTIRLNYQIDDELTVCLPETEFRLALINLLLNAIHAIGQQSGEIQLSASRQDDQIVLSIEDSGPGFAKTLLENGIRPFVSLKEKGTGLGLAMVQRFIKSQHGSISLYNTQQGHACVTLTLPFRKS